MERLPNFWRAEIRWRLAATIEEQLYIEDTLDQLEARWRQQQEERWDEITP